MPGYIINAVTIGTAAVRGNLCAIHTAPLKRMLNATRERIAVVLSMHSASASAVYIVEGALLAGNYLIKMELVNRKARLGQKAQGSL